MGAAKAAKGLGSPWRSCPVQPGLLSRLMRLRTFAGQKIAAAGWCISSATATMLQMMNIYIYVYVSTSTNALLSLFSWLWRWWRRRWWWWRWRWRWRCWYIHIYIYIIYILVLRCSFPCALKLNVQTPIGPSNQDYCDKIGPALRQISMQDHLWWFSYCLISHSWFCI